MKVIAEKIVRYVTLDGLHVKAMDVGNLVRCKDCEHYNAGFECLIEGYGIERDKDWFCADAERRTE